MAMTLKGTLVGTVLFVALAIAYTVLQMKIAQRGQPAVVGIDIRTLASWTIQDPMFWVVLVVCCAAGSVLVRYWQR